MQLPYFVGLDLGTTSVKACAFNQGGALLEECALGYELRHPVQGAAIQSPQEVLAAAKNTLGKLVEKMGYSPKGVGLSTAMHSVILLGENQQPISPIITWADTRAVSVMGDFSLQKRNELMARTGTPVHPMSPLVKLRWLHQTQNEYWSNATYVSDLKSYLVNEWTTDGLLLDTNLASATGLYGAKAKTWDQEALELAGVTAAQLPQVVSPNQRLSWKPAVAAELRLIDVPFVIGGSDGCLANLGSDLKPGDVALSIGTSGAVRATHQRIEIDPAVGLFNYHIHENDYAIGGATNNGGNVLEWLFNLLGKPYANVGDLIEAAAEVECEGLQFTPFIYGERAPIYDATASGSFTGIRSHHLPAQYARAALEGVTENLINILYQLEKITGPAQRIIASGGFTKSDFWVQLLAEKTGRDVIVADTAQASARGAALLAGGNWG